MLVAVLVALSGCGGVLHASATVVHPAALPLRSFPRIWIAARAREPGATLADALAAHLLGTGHAEVRRLDVRELEPARQRRTIPPATVVVIVNLRLREESRAEWTTRPETVCGPLGCTGAQRTRPYDVALIRGRLEVMVYDGPVAVLQQRVELRVREEGDAFELMRARVVRRLAQLLANLVDERVEVAEVELLDVEVPRVQRALTLMERGRWLEGRQLLEAFVRRGLRGIEREQRARILFDLGQARRFDTRGGDAPRRYSAARRAFRAAVRLVPDDRYDEVLRALALQERSARVLAEQRAAAAHNFQVVPPSSAPPSAPPSYVSP